MLSRFNIYVSVSDRYGIGKNGKIPWKNTEDLNYFKSNTIGDGNAVVIMGRKTYESLPIRIDNTRKLPQRENFVITSEKINGVKCFSSLGRALYSAVKHSKVSIIGGQQLYEEAINRYAYLCDYVAISRIPGNYDCDTFFPYNNLIKYGKVIDTDYFLSFELELIKMNVSHEENQYLQIMKKIIENGDKRLDRTNVGTISLFGQRMEFDLRKGFPLLTTKKTWFKGIKEELLFFISGKTDTKILENKNVNFWKGNTSEEFLKKSNLPWKEGDMGPGYSFQWRHSGAEYKGCDEDYKRQGEDQLQNLINGLKNNPFGRRHIVSAWDVANIKLMALPPCHCFFQFYVGCDFKGDPTFLDCTLYQRSADMFLGVPFNIASYALLMEMIGHITGLKPRKFIHDLGDTHIYSNHIEQVIKQLSRTPYAFPTLKFNRKIECIDDFKSEDIEIVNYISHSKISAKMAV